MSNQSNIDRFEELFIFACGDRNGSMDLLGYIRNSDFYSAPASTRFHACHEGGLLEHTLNVYDCLMSKINNRPWKGLMGKGLEDGKSIALCALLHDLCKSNMYVVEWKNKKIYSENGSKRDAAGRYDWETVPGYTVDNASHPYGHGECSVMMIESFMKLKTIERYAIRWHMGFTEPKENWNYLSAAIRKYPIILALHESDLESTYLLEEES